MRRPLTTWMLGGLLAFASASWAQGVPPAGEERNRTTGSAPSSYEGTREPAPSRWRALRFPTTVFARGLAIAAGVPEYRCHGRKEVVLLA